MEKSVLEESRKEAEKKYDELNEQVSVGVHSACLFLFVLAP